MLCQTSSKGRRILIIHELPSRGSSLPQVAFNLQKREEDRLRAVANQLKAPCGLWLLWRIRIATASTDLR